MSRNSGVRCAYCNTTLHLSAPIPLPGQDCGLNTTTSSKPCRVSPHIVRRQTVVLKDRFQATSLNKYLVIFCGLEVKCDMPHKYHSKLKIQWSYILSSFSKTRRVSIQVYVKNEFIVKSSNMKILEKWKEKKLNLSNKIYPQELHL